MEKYITIIGTLDTKGKEIKYFDDRIKDIGVDHNVNTIILDIVLI